MKNSWIVFIAQVVAFISTLYVNYLANAKPINGYTSAQVSDMFPNLIVPAGFTFAIWGLIYTLLACYLIYYAFVLVKKESGIVYQFQNLAPVFMVSCLINCCWMISFHHLKIGLSVVLMICLLGCLTYLFLKTQGKIQLSLWPKFAFESYFAWLNVAMVANICAFLVSINWDGFGVSENTWAFIILSVLISLGLYVALKFKTIIYPLVISWAIYGIHSKLQETNFEGAFMKFTLVFSIIFAVMAAFNIVRDLFKSSMAD